MSKYEKPDGSLISFMSNKIKSGGGINLAQGLPGFNPPNTLLEQLQITATDLSVQQYPPGSGYLPLVRQIANKYRVENNNVLITTGATEAISLLYLYIYQQIDQDFSVLAFDPVYESYKFLPQIYKNKFIAFKGTKNISETKEKFTNTIKTNNVKLILLSSPGNPYGKIWSKKEIDLLLELSITLDFYIIFDAVYKDIYFQEKPYIPTLNHDKLFYVDSFSKMLSITGWRIGYLIAPNIHIDKIKYIHDYSGLCSPHPLQKALSLYLSKSNFGEEYSQNLREKIKASYLLLNDALDKLKFDLPKTTGGYFIWAKLPTYYPHNGFRFAIDLYDQTGVAVVPGIHFSKAGDRFVRFNIARVETEILNAIKKINDFLILYSSSDISYE